MKQSANILFVMDGKPGDTGCLKQAIVIARESNSSLTVLDVMESLPRPARMLVTAMPAGDLKSSVLSRRQDQLEELLTMIKPDAIDMLRKHLHCTSDSSFQHPVTSVLLVQLPCNCVILKELPPFFSNGLRSMHYSRFRNLA